MISRQHAYKLRELIVKASTSLSDGDAYYGKELFVRWSGDGVEYKNGDRVRYDGELYKYISADPTISQPSWNPKDAHSLWVRIDDPAIEFPDWRQPTGSTDAYRFGAKVSHNNKHWVSALDHNTYEPGVYGWDEVTEGE